MTLERFQSLLSFEDLLQVIVGVDTNHTLADVKQAEGATYARVLDARVQTE
jgi:hypothetical protein